MHTVKVLASSGDANADRTFTVTVDKRATALTYDGPTSGQLSDPAPLHATLRDAATDAPIAGKGIGFVCQLITQKLSQGSPDLFVQTKATPAEVVAVLAKCAARTVYA